jgi:hypothetical protein
MGVKASTIFWRRHWISSLVQVGLTFLSSFFYDSV